MRYFSVCAVVKNEGLYLADWLWWHLSQGVEHFFLYDNISTDNTKEIYKRFDRYITLKNIPNNPCQFIAYNDCVTTCKDKTKWCAFLDCDEFLVAPNHSNLALPFVHIFKEHYDAKNVSAVGVRWKFFGSNGQISYKPYPVIERFTRAQKGCDKHVKSIVKLSETTCVGNNPHTFRVGGLIIDEKKKILPQEYALEMNPDKRSAHILRINHYHTKSYEEYKIRKQLPDPGTGIVKTPIQLEESFRAHDCNDEFNIEMFK